ncbi:hypothetical protein RI129_005098 [Pyrocoelia pectoralis]|uniref:Endothelin-converting enzyme 1 n=1 Tax=Pyrocoelia pectoralis TaxID=417401 RepID=A0AAN7VM42_9COLE
MASGSYTIGQSAPKDASFRTCLCAMLVFIAICAILLLALLLPKKGSREDEKGGEYMKYHGIRPVTEKEYTKVVSSTSVAPTTVGTTVKHNVTTKVNTDTINRPVTTFTEPVSQSTEHAEYFITDPKVDDITTTTESDNSTSTITVADKRTTLELSTSDTTLSTKISIDDRLSRNFTTSTPVLTTTVNTVTTSNTTPTSQTTTANITTVKEIAVTNLTTMQETTGSNITTVTTPSMATKSSTQTTVSTTANISTVMETAVTNLTTVQETTSSNITTPSIATKSNTQTTLPSTVTVSTTSIKTTTATNSEYIDDSMSVVEATGLDMTETPPTTKQPAIVLSTTEEEPEPICTTSKCKSVASGILSSMNHSVDPCEDFYEFACGGMKVDYDNSDSWRRISEQIHLINESSPPSLKTYKTFYDSCVSHEYLFDYEKRTATVQDLVKEVGNFMDTQEGSENIDITKIFANLVLRRSLQIMDVELDIDKQTSKFILKLDVPNKVSILLDQTEASKLTDLQNRCLDKVRNQMQQEYVDLSEIHDYFVECQKDYTVFLFSIQTAAGAIGFFSNWTNQYNRTQVMQDLRTTIEWDVLDHSNVLPPPNEKRETMLLKEYTLHTISELQTEYPLIQWKRFFEIITEQVLNDDTVIQVYFPDYFQQLFAGLSSSPLWKINNALIAFFANHLYETMVIPRAKDVRENYCIQLSTKLFRDISSHLYIKTWSKTQLDQIPKFLSNIFDTIKKNLAVELKQATWLDDETRKSMLIKAKKMILTFTKENDSYNNEDYLNEKYKNIQLRKDTFMRNVVGMLEFERKSLYKLTGRLFNVDYLWNYFVNVFDTFPTSFYTERLIMVPLGMMSGPLRGTPGYITMSRTGLSLAREIGRHFDPVGIQNDMRLTPSSKATYDAMVEHMKQDLLLKATAKTLKNQKVSFQVYPNLSANERISDNTGMRLIEHGLDSLSAENMLPWISTTFTREQIFYISIAQEYCQITNIIDYMLALFESEDLPPSLRVENIVTNSEKFAQVFECPIGSEMNNNPMKTQFPNLVKEENSNEQ